MKVSRGDVVLLDFPFVSGVGVKTRPAVVIQNDQNNQRLQTTILAPITSNVAHAHEPTQVVIDVATPDGAQTGLLRNSCIKSENLATVDIGVIRRRIGTLSPTLAASLDSALRHALGLP